MSRKKQTASVKTPEYTVVRPWPGVHAGQPVELRPDRAKRLIKGGFVKVRNA